MRQHSSRPAALVAIVLLLTIPGCAAGRGGSPDDGSTAGPPSPGGSAASQSMMPRDDLGSTRPITWDTWRLVDPTTVEVTFLAGPADCEGITASVDEDATTVTIDLRSGPLPGAGECPAIALTTTATIDLAEPLDGRDVVQSPPATT